jgi:hypothetical protein
MEGQDVDRSWELRGPLAELASAIDSGTGSPELRADSAGLRAALRAGFPALPEPAALEGCTTHPALTLRFRAPGFGREAVKVVLVPRPGRLEARARLELPAGSYKQATLSRLLAFLESILEDLHAPE